MVLFSIILASAMYIIMIIINGLANALPLNGISTGAVSFKYPNLFQPAGITFSIWGLIYALLLVFLIYQFIQSNTISVLEAKQLFIKVNFIFALTSLLNVLWLFAWHFDKIIVSTIIMVGLLVVLIILVKMINQGNWITRLSFSIYLGWITIATIANITIMFVKLGVQNFNQLATIITIVILIIGGLISCLWIIKEKDLAFGLVILWAYLGILIRYLSNENWIKNYPLIVITIGIAIVSLLIVNGVQLFKMIE